MSNRRDLILDEYDISRYAYRELYNFCMQYPEKKQKLRDLRGLSLNRMSGMPKGGATSNPTENRGMLAARYSDDCEMIEQCALKAGGIIYPWLLDGVTEGASYEYMNRMEYFRGVIPVGKSTYYVIRRRFFWLLATRKGVA